MSGILGVTFDRRKGKWAAQIGINGKNILVGRFDTPEKAGEAYLEAKASIHGFSRRIITGRSID